MIFNFVSKLLYSIPLRFQFYRRLAFTRVFNFVQFNKINGDYIEFGVASGNTLKIAKYFLLKNELCVWFKLEIV